MDTVCWTLETGEFITKEVKLCPFSVEEIEEDCVNSRNKRSKSVCCEGCFK